MSLAPIAIFTFNRPDHTRLTIEALKKNELAAESDVFIFSDGPRRDNDLAAISAVREYLKSVGGFKSVKIIAREKNLGLAASIMSGVTDIVDEFGKVIVLEDDIITSKFFLRYMNDALDLYADDDRVMHISGYTYPGAAGLPPTFFYNQTSCWGWGTWQRAWRHFNGDVDQLIKEAAKIKNKKNGYFKIALSQLKANKRGEINTWGARWQMSVLLRGGYCLHANSSFTYNIGHDGSGVNCDQSVSYGDKVTEDYSGIRNVAVVESPAALRFGNDFLKGVIPSLPERAVMKIRGIVKKIISR